MHARFSKLPVIIATVLVPTVAMGQETLTVRGVVRDFSVDHPDFNVVAPGGHGHVAGTVGLTLDVMNAPLLSSGGYQVDQQWEDIETRFIAPHLASTVGDLNGPIFLVESQILVQQGTLNSLNAAGQAVVVTNATAPGAVTLQNNANILGSIYTGVASNPDIVVEMEDNCEITGYMVPLSQPVAMPAAAMPDDFGPNVGDVTLMTQTITGELHADDFAIARNHTVTVEGTMRIRVDNDFLMMNNSHMVLAPGATLEMFVAGNAVFENNASINENGDIDAFQLTSMYGAAVELVNRNRLFGTVIAPESTLTMANHALLNGSIAVDQLHVLNNSEGSTGGDQQYQSSCGSYADTAGSEGLSSNGGVTSTETFSHWFNNVVGQNLSAGHNIRMTRDSNGVWEYLDGEFHPIDGRLLGNEGDDHNNFFTYAIEATADFTACEGKFIEFDGGDGTWIFINGEMVVDLGGTQSNTTQIIELDRLGLEDGTSIEVHIMYAQRCSSNCVFRLRTNLDLMTDHVVASVSAMFD